MVRSIPLLQAVFRPDLSKMDVLIKLRPSVYKTRILEAIDLEVPSWALKKTLMDEKSTADSKGTAFTKEPDPVTLDLPHPGASYWPTGYLCDPVTWILRQIQVRCLKSHRISAFVFTLVDTLLILFGTHRYLREAIQLTEMKWTLFEMGELCRFCEAFEKSDE